MATSQLHTAPLKERIAALQGKVSGATAQDSQVPSRSHSPLPNVGGSSSSTGTPGRLPGAAPLSRTGTVRDKAARFEEKGGMPVPRGAFGMSLPPEHTVKDVRRGELWGNRLPELGRGVVTATHSRNVSQSYSDVSFGGDDDERHSSHSRSASPLPGQNNSVSGRRRTTSSFAGSAYSRRMSNTSDGYDHNSRFSASNPDLTDPHGGKSLNIPPVPPLPASVVEARLHSAAAAEVERASSDGHDEPPVAPELGTAPTVPTAAGDSAATVPPAAMETTAVVEPTGVEHDTDPPSPSAALPVPALRVEIVDTLDAGPRSVTARFNHGSSLPAQLDHEDEPESPLFYVPPGKPSGVPATALHSEPALALPSRRSPPPPSLQFSNRSSTDTNSLVEPHTSSEPATPFEILTPSTMDAFPTPPTLSPQDSPRKSSDNQHCTPSSRTSAPAPPPSGAPPLPPSLPLNQPMKTPAERRPTATVGNQALATSRTVDMDEDDDEMPPPPPPKDDLFNMGRRNDRGTRKSSVDSSRTSETSHVSHTSTLPITPPSTLNGLGAPGVKRPTTTAPRKPLVVPNWWEDDEDQPVTTGWVRVVSRQ